MRGELNPHNMPFRRFSPHGSRGEEAVPTQHDATLEQRSTDTGVHQTASPKIEGCILRAEVDKKLKTYKMVQEQNTDCNHFIDDMKSLGIGARTNFASHFETNDSHLRSRAESLTKRHSDGSR